MFGIRNRAALFGAMLLVGCKPAAAPVAPTGGAAPAARPHAVESATRNVELTWVVHPSRGGEASEGGPKREVEIVTRIGDAAERVSLGAHAGDLLPADQSPCDASLRDESRVSVLRFHGMGPKTLVARRVQPTRIEVTFKVDADDEPAKVAGTLATITVPADARIVDGIREIRDGKEAPFACSPTFAWSDEVTLVGTVVERSVMSARGGSIETLFLVPNVAVNLRKGRPNTNESAVTAARELWLGEVAGVANAKAVVGKKVVFRGHFEASTTGHHHSHPWLRGQLSIP